LRWCASPGRRPGVGVDAAPSAIGLTRANLSHQALHAALAVADGEGLPFTANCMDFVYAHGV
jgi:hypothetical protein